MCLTRSLTLVAVSLVLLVVNSVVGDLRSVQLQDDGTLIAHPKSTEEFTEVQVLDRLHYRPKGDLAKAEYIANLLYKIEAKEVTQLCKRLSVADLIAQNELNSLESGCTKEALRRRADVYLTAARTCPFKPSGLYFGISMYTHKLLRMATYYCYQNKDQLVKNGIVTEDFLDSLNEAYFKDALSDDDYDEEVEVLVSRPSTSEIALLISLEETKEEEAAKKERNLHESATGEEVGNVQNRQKAGSQWLRKLVCLTK